MSLMKPPIQDVYKRKVEEVERETRDFWAQKLGEWQETQKSNSQSPDPYIELVRCHLKLGQHKDACAVLEQGLVRVPPEKSYRLYLWQIRLLERLNRTREAIESARRANELFPNDLALKMLESLLLPVIYDSQAEIKDYRNRFTQGLRRVCQEVSLATLDERKNALSAIAGHTNLHLTYQAKNDLELQMEYGKLIHRILAANYPDWVKALPMPEIPSGGKLRIGYVSSRFRNFSTTKYFLGWIQEHKKDSISVHSYHVGHKTDSSTEEVRKASHIFRHIPDSLEDACRAILNDHLHILVYLDVGLNAITNQLAASRLAPVQCAAWDQPVTTGLPTIDYFVSGALTEPGNAQDHYSEELTLLLGVGVCYRKPVIPAALLNKTRRDFQLRDDAVVYLCIQYAYKYLPDQDQLLAKIATKVPNAQFVFLTENEFIASDLRRRLQRAFSAVNLSADDFCVLLPAIERFDYWNLCLLGDVFLDSLGWSGGVSTFEAISCGLPVATLPGELMRGRQSYAILTQLGVTGTIARSREEYVEIAARLGLDRQWREDIIRNMGANHASLFSDTRCVRALEEFYERAVEERLRTQKPFTITTGPK
jgi:protein O-GlcNAc transferase